MTDLIPLLRPRLPDESQAKPYLKRMDQHRRYSNGGPLVRSLEEAYGRFLDVDPDLIVSASSGTAGLTAAVMALTARQWVVPAWTFVASPIAVLQAGRDLIFCDARDDTGVPDFSELDPRRDDTGILPVMHLGAFDLAPYAGQGDVVIDAAASIVNAQGRVPTMGPDSCIVFSLHATKILGCGEGGIVLCGSGEVASRVRSTLNFGLDEERIAIRRGFNGKMSEIGAAYGLAALDRSSSDLADWRVAQDRARAVSEALGLRLASPLPGDVTPYWVVMWPETAGSLSSARQYLQSQGVATRSWWPLPCSAMPAFREFARSTPIADDLSRRLLGLPMFPDMTTSHFDQIYSTLRELVK